MAHLRLFGFAALALALLAGGAEAQEFRIYTRVMLVPAGGKEPQVVGRSLTLFHAGRVYDYMDEAGEVIVLEPAHRRYTIVDLKRGLSTAVDFDELNNLLKVGRHEAENSLERLASDAKPASDEAARMLRFQLDPKFEERYDAGRATLTLSSRMIRYDAKCAPAAGEVVDAWSRYADAMCRLNFVLHPSALLPEPRLALNAALAQRRAVPTSVELTIETKPRLQLRAEHEIAWTLDARDRSHIHDWANVMENSAMKRVTFHEYQRLVAGGSPSTRK